MEIKTRIPKELVAELEAIYRPRRYLPNETLPEIMEHSGQLAVVEYIRANYERQQENILGDLLIR